MIGRRTAGTPGRRRCDHAASLARSSPGRVATSPVRRSRSGCWAARPDRRARHGAVPQGGALGAVPGADDDHPGGAVHRPGRAVPRRRADRRLHRRGDDAVPVRADADRRRLRPTRWSRRCAGNGSRPILVGLGFAHPAGRRDRPASLSTAPRSAARPRPTPAGRQRRRAGGADLHPLPVGVRAHQRAADHRGGRGDGADAPRAAASRARRSASCPPSGSRPAGTRHRCPAPACTPATTPSTCPRCCPTGPSPRIVLGRSRLDGDIRDADRLAIEERHTGCHEAVTVDASDGDPGCLAGASMNPDELPVPVGDAVHHRRRRRAGAPQRHRHVHVRRADAQRRPTWRSSPSPGCTATSTARSSRSS